MLCADSTRYTQDDQNPEASEIHPRASYHRYQRRVQRVSGRGSQLSKSRLSLPGTLSAALTKNRKSSTDKQSDAVVAREETQQKLSTAPTSSAQQPLLSKNSPDSEEDLATDRSLSPLTQWANDSERIQSMLDAHNAEHHHGVVMTANRSSTRFSRENSQTLVMERRGYMMQVVGSGKGSPTAALFTVHRDGSAPNRAILQPVPVLLPTQSQEQSQSFMQRVAKALSRTTSAPGADQDGLSNRRATSVRMHKKASSTSESNPVWASMPSVKAQRNANSSGTLPARVRDASGRQAYNPGRGPPGPPTLEDASVEFIRSRQSAAPSSNITTTPRKESLNAKPLPKNV